MAAAAEGAAAALRPTISFRALQRARTTVEDIALSYFPYHGLRVPEDLFKYLDVLVWVEGTIYQLDEDNERLTMLGQQDAQLLCEGIAGLLAVLRDEGLCDSRIEAELTQGRRYWEQEQALCRVLLDHPRPLVAPAQQLTLADVLACHEAKSFDYRVLHLLLHRLARRPYDEQLLAFLRVDELLVDISDDLVDYEDDVCNNSFNIFRCYVHLFGRDAELRLVERICALEQEHSKLLAGLAPGLQAHYWKRHKDASIGQGSERWVFPPPAYDEAEFRQRVAEAEAEGGGAAAAAAAAAARRAERPT